MKTTSVLFPLLIVVFLFGRANSHGQVTYAHLKTNLVPAASGAFPISAPIEGSDGKLYGACGNLFTVNKDGSAFTILNTNVVASSMASPFEASDGKLYFVTGPQSDVNSRQFGTLARINKDGTGYQNLGVQCSASVMEGPDGKLYGVAALGADEEQGTSFDADDKGRVFKINKDGSGYTVIYNFTNGVTPYVGVWATPNGYTPNSPLLLGSDGALYGTTAYGGDGISYYGSGVIYKVNTDGTGFTVLHKFAGRYPDPDDYINHPLVEMDGAIYGIYPSDDGAVLFKINKDGSNYTHVYTFDSCYGYRGFAAGIVKGADNRIYGTVDHAISYSPTHVGYMPGLLYRVEKDGSNFCILHQGADIRYNSSMSLGSDGAFYGLGFAMTNNPGQGILYKLTASSILVDTTPPLLSCSDVTANSFGSGAVVFYDVSVLDMDPCPTITADFMSGSYFPLGTNPVTVTARDRNNNTSQCTFNVIVRDLMGPIISNATPLIEVKATNLAGNIVNFGVTATDAFDPAPIITYNPPSGSLFPIGYTMVDVIAYDNSFNTNHSSIMVHVYDHTPPVINISPGSIIRYPATSILGGVANFSVTASDNLDPSPTVTYDPPSGSLLTLGQHVVSVVAKDQFNNKSYSMFVADIRDMTPPVIGCSNMVVYVDGAGTNMTVSIPVTDNVDANPTVALSYGAGSFYAVNNTYNVLVTAWDHSFNFTNSSFTVTVLPSAVRILSQPASQDAFIGGKVRFSVSAVGMEGGPLKYQWRKNGTRIAGATNSFYAITSVAATSPGAYSVVVSNNLAAVASSAANLNLVPNLFLARKGTYNGLFYENEVASHQSSGFITFTLSDKGVYSGKIIGDASTYTFKGEFDVYGNTETDVSRGAYRSPLRLAMRITPANDILMGTLTEQNNLWNAEVVTTRAFYSTTNITSLAGKYTMSLINDNNGTTAPGGDSYGLVTINNTGTVTMSGAVPDATISQSVALGKDGAWPVYVPLYLTPTLYTNGLVTVKNNEYRGSLLGWLTVTNSPTNNVQGSLLWIKTGAKGKYYAAGFTNDSPVVGSKFVPPAPGIRAVNLASGTVTLSGGDLIAPIVNPVIYAVTNKIVATPIPADKLALTVNTNSGLVTGTFIDPTTHLSTPIKGVILQNQTNVQGFFLSTNKSGSFLLEGN